MEQTLDNTLPLSQSDSIALLYGKPLDKVPAGLYIPPDALKVFLESFEGPLDLLLWLIQKQKFDVMDIPMATLTEQYMQYVELIRKNNLDLAGDYLVMAAHLMAIKSQLLLPLRKADTGEEVEDPKAELMRRLIEYQKMKLAAQELDRLPISGRDFSPVDVSKPESAPDLPDVSRPRKGEGLYSQDRCVRGPSGRIRTDAACLCADGGGDRGPCERPRELRHAPRG